MPAFGRALRRHFPGFAALLALAIASAFWIWVRQDTTVTINVFYGWRQCMIVACAGIVLGGGVAELFARAEGRAPGDVPLRSLLAAALFALPFYGFMLLLGAVFED